MKLAFSAIRSKKTSPPPSASAEPSEGGREARRKTQSHDMRFLTGPTQLTRVHSICDRQWALQKFAAPHAISAGQKSATSGRSVRCNGELKSAKDHEEGGGGVRGCGRPGGGEPDHTSRPPHAHASAAAAAAIRQFCDCAQERRA